MLTHLELLYEWLAETFDYQLKNVDLKNSNSNKQIDNQKQPVLLAQDIFWRVQAGVSCMV